MPSCAAPPRTDAAVNRVSQGSRLAVGRMESGPAGSRRNRIPSFSAAGFASRSAWLGVIRHAVPADAPCPTAPRSSSSTSRPANASCSAAEAPIAPAPMTAISVVRGTSTVASYGRRTPCPTLPRVEIVLALGAALAWGFADFASGVKSRTNSTIVVTAIVLGAGGIVTLVIAAATEEAPTGRTVALALAAGAATGLGVTMFFHALAIGVIGTVAPITCAGTSVPVIWGLVQGERPSVGQLLGVVLAIGGVVVIARAVADEDTTPAVNARLALILAIAAAFTLGTYYVVAREASDAGPLWYAALGQLFAATPLVLLAFARRAPIPNPRESRALLGIAMANGAGWILSVNALKEGLLSVVSVLIALYPALTVLFARIFLSERLSQLQRAGAGIVFVGVALIAAT